MTTAFIIEQLNGPYAFCRLDPKAPWPVWASGQFVSMSRSDQELSVLCPEASLPTALPDDARCDRGFSVLRIRGTVDIDVVGLLKSLSTALADGGISVTVIGTFDTDYMLIRQHRLAVAMQLLRDAGFTVAS